MTRITRLRVGGIRNLADIDISPGLGLNVFVGENGAGKTSVLEALHCLSRGRSFLGSGRHEYLNRDSRKAVIVVDLETEPGDRRVLGLEREGPEWRAKANGVSLKSLALLAEQLPFCVFHPGLHRLVDGVPEDRRQFLDFGVFHVERRFIHHWRRYRNALKQRNASIRSGAGLNEIGVWDSELIEHGEAIADYRSQQATLIAGQSQQYLASFAPTLAGLSLTLAQGWPEDQSFADALKDCLVQDRELGYTSRGPHRADLRMVLHNQRIAGRLSRGQQKMIALSLLLSQVQVMASAGEVPVMGFDDLPSELDKEHQQSIIELVRTIGGQVWVTGNACPAGVVPGGADKVFHVEQGRVSELV
ncbi:MAG: DNA replication/repair protein RecF [Lysobacterales bacterium]